MPSCNSLLVSKRQDAKRQPGVGARGKPPNLGVAMNAVKSGGHVPRSARPATKLPSAKRQPRINARVSPLSREASDGGAKTRRLTFANALRSEEKLTTSRMQARFGGACHALRFLSTSSFVAPHGKTSPIAKRDRGFGGETERGGLPHDLGST